MKALSRLRYKQQPGKNGSWPKATYGPTARKVGGQMTHKSPYRVTKSLEARLGSTCSMNPEPY